MVLPPQDYELPAEPDDDALAVAEAEAAGRAELSEEEAAQWRDVRSWEDECWHDVVREQRCGPGHPPGLSSQPPGGCLGGDPPTRAPTRTPKIGGNCLNPAD